MVMGAMGHSWPSPFLRLGTNDCVPDIKMGINLC